MAVAPRTVIVGAGRLGRGLGGLLIERGVSVRFAVRGGARDLPGPAGRVDDPATYRGARWILLGTPDDQIRSAARALGELGVVGPKTVVLHLSGVHDRAALKPLRLSGAALGSFHPLQSIALPAAARERLPGSYVGLEGDPAAIRVGRRLARLFGMIPVTIPDGAKPAYHAAATMVSTYVVALYHVAATLLIDSGVERRAAGAMLVPLLEGAVANLRLLPPALAMTGAIRRGDAATVKAHLASLNPADRRLYLELGHRALELVRRTPLDRNLVAALEAVLR